MATLLAWAKNCAVIRQPLVVRVTEASQDWPTAVAINDEITFPDVLRTFVGRDLVVRKLSNVPSRFWPDADPATLFRVVGPASPEQIEELRIADERRRERAAREARVCRGVSVVSGAASDGGSC